MEIKHKRQNRDLLTQHNKLNWQSLIGWSMNSFTSVINLVINIPVMNEIWRERRELEQMTMDQIRDIGLDPILVTREYQRGFFDIPAERKKALFVLALDELVQGPTPATRATLKA